MSTEAFVVLEIWVGKWQGLFIVGTVHQRAAAGWPAAGWPAVGLGGISTVAPVE